MESALIVIDVQRGLFSPTPIPFNAIKIINNINLAIEIFRKRDKSIIFVQHETLLGNLKYQSNGWELDPRLQSSNSDYKIRKTTTDSFLGTDLNGLLMSKNVKTIFICGYASEFCIDSTIRRGAAIGYDVVAISDAHTTHDKPHASAKIIRIHHNETWRSITSFEGKIASIPIIDIINNINKYENM